MISLYNMNCWIPSDPYYKAGHYRSHLLYRPLLLYIMFDQELSFNNPTALKALVPLGVQDKVESVPRLHRHN